MLASVTGADPVYWECVDFLYREAALQDDRALHAWLELLTEDIDYRAPLRATRQGADAATPFSDEAFYLRESFASLRTRVARFDTGYAWAEDPPSRTRRYVTNIRVQRTARADELEVRSNLLLFRARGEGQPELLAGERRDTLRHVEGQWKLAGRLILLDHTTLTMQNLAVLL